MIVEQQQDGGPGVGEKVIRGLPERKPLSRLAPFDFDPLRRSQPHQRGGFGAGAKQHNPEPGHVMPLTYQIRREVFRERQAQHRFAPCLGVGAGVRELGLGDVEARRELLELVLDGEIGEPHRLARGGKAGLDLGQARRRGIHGLDRLGQVRRNRLTSMGESRDSDYVELEAVRAEIAATRQLFENQDWPMIDVSRRSIEETAAAVMNLLAERKEAIG